MLQSIQLPQNTDANQLMSPMAFAANNKLEQQQSMPMIANPPHVLSVSGMCSENILAFKV